MTDAKLLIRFANDRDPDAFAELVRRHMNVVYTAARRQAAGDGHLAEDITQQVFILLSRKASKLHGEALLGGWLFNTVRFVARSELRARRRRNKHETRAAVMTNQIQASADRAEQSNWREADNLLDDAMAKLDRESRGVLVLRYLEGKSTQEVGDHLGITEVAARKRVSRAVEQLRSLFARRGVVLSSSQIAEGLAIPALPAPTHLVTSTISAASSAATARAASAMLAGKGLVITASIGAVIIAAVVISILIAWHSYHVVANVPLSPTTSKAPIKPPGVVYEANFAKGAGPEWSMQTPAVTKDKKHPFLGPFLEPELRFKLDGLPPHQFIRLTFDLLTYDRWNGDGQFGRDLWDMRVVDGQPLIHTTFSNCGMFSNNNEQSFPDQYPWYPGHVGWTGSATRQSLGYTTPYDNENGVIGCDSTYAFDIIFPHSADTLALAFKSQLKNHAKKPYGFLTFKVTTLDHAASADEQTIASWWTDLASDDQLKAYRATWLLIATGDTATAYIQHHLPDAVPGNKAPPINIDQNAMWEYDSFQYTIASARQRARAIHVLEVIHSPASLAILKSIGFNGTPQGGPPDRWSTPHHTVRLPTQPTRPAQPTQPAPPSNDPAI